MATVSTPTPEETRVRADPWRIAWRGLTSDGWLACLLLATALLLALAAWLPQSPDSAADPIAYSRWRGETQARFGNVFTPLREIGLFSLERSVALRGLVALVALSLILRVMDSLQSAWLARRLALAKAGPLATYLGALMLITSLLVSSLTGWRAGNLTLGAGQMVPITTQGGLLYNLRLDALDSAQRGQVTLLQETETVGTGYLSPQRPIELAGLTISLDGIGPAIRASATLTDGTPALLQASAASNPTAELLLLLTHDEPDRVFAVSQTELVIRLSRGSNAQVRAQVYRGRTGAIIYDDNVPSSGQITIENVNLRLSREAYGVLDAARDPGKPLALIGLIILALGLIVSMVWSAARGQVISWKIGWAILCVLAGGAVMLNLLQGQPLPGQAWISPALVAAWLIGCAAAVWNKRALHWATLIVALLALIGIASAVLNGF